MRKHLMEIFEYRDMVNSLVKRDLRGKYKGSVLGFLWTFINPLCQIIVYTVVFSVIIRSGLEQFIVNAFSICVLTFCSCCIFNWIWMQNAKA